MPRRLLAAISILFASAFCRAFGGDGALSHDALFGPNTTFDYFGRCRTLTVSEDRILSLNNAATLAQCSLLCYVTDRPFTENALAKAKLDRLQYFDRKGTYAFLAEGENCLVLAFRGTETADRQDILTDAKFALVRYGERGKAHKGFVDALDFVDTEITAAIAERQAKTRKPIFVTGHSLGAALATLWTIKHPEDVVALYTFGGPRIANLKLAKAAAETAPLYRFVNDNDFITRLPPPPIYQHIGSTYFLNTRGELVLDPPFFDKLQERFDGHREFIQQLFQEHWMMNDFSAIPSDYVVDHSPVRYAEILIALAELERLETSRATP